MPPHAKGLSYVGTNSPDASLLDTIADATRQFTETMNQTYMIKLPFFSTIQEQSQIRRDLHVINQLTVLREHEERLNRLCEDLRVAKLTLAQHGNRISMALSPINIFPDEILRDIFGMLGDAFDEPEGTYLLRISQVCHRWRDISTHQGYLWDRVYLSWPQERCDVWEERSGMSLLDVTWDIERGPRQLRTRFDPRHILPVIESRRGTLFKAYSLHLHDFNPSSSQAAYTVLAELLSCSFPYLHSLSIIADHDPEVAEVCIPCESLPESIRSLDLWGGFKIQNPHFDNLSCLSLHNVQFSVSMWEGALTSLGQIEVLALSTATIFYDDDDENPLPLLHGKIYPSFPLLRSLGLEIVEPCFFDIFARPGSVLKLREFTMEPNGAQDRAADVIRNAPQLETLSVDSEDPAGVAVVISALTANRALRSLHIDTHGRWDLGELRTFVEGRFSQNNRLQELHAYLRGHQDEEDWFKSRVGYLVWHCRAENEDTEDEDEEDSDDDDED